MKLLAQSRSWTILWALEIVLGAICLYAVTSTQIGDLRDLEAYIDASIRISSGEPLYSSNMKALPYLYPPSLAILFQPFVSLPLKSVAYFWNALSYLSLIFGAVLFARGCGRIFTLSPLGVAVVRTMTLFGVLIFPPTWLGWRLGQVHGLMFLLVCGALEAASAGRFKSLGGWIAAGAWLRASPVLLLAGALTKKSIRPLVVGFSIVSFLALVLQASAGEISDLLDFLVGNGIAEYIVKLSFEPNNIAIPWTLPYGILKGVMCGVVVALLLIPRKRAANEFLVVRNISLLVVLMHLVGPILWIYHLVAVLPVVGLAVVSRASRPDWQRSMGTFITIFLCVIIMGGDMDFWRVNATSEEAQEFMRVLQNIALVVVAGVAGTARPIENNASA